MVEFSEKEYPKYRGWLLHHMVAKSLQLGAMMSIPLGALLAFIFPPFSLSSASLWAFYFMVSSHPFFFSKK